MSMSMPFDEAGLNLDGMTNSQQPPLFFDLAESLPGITTAALWNSRRYANTLMRGGWADTGSNASRYARGRANALGAFVGDVAEKKGAYLGAGRFNTKRAKTRAGDRAGRGAAPFLKPSLANHVPLTPSGAVKKLGRFSSITALTGDRMSGYYTPLQAIPAFMDMLSKREGFRRKFNLQEGERAYSGGVLGRINSMNQLYDLDAKIAKAGASTKRGQALAAKRQQMVTNIVKVQGVSTAQAAKQAGIKAGQEAASAARAFGLNIADNSPLVASVRDTAERSFAATAARQAADDPLKALSSTMTTGVLSNRITKYYAGVLDPRRMTEGQQAVARRVISKQKRGGHTGRAAAYSQFLDDFGSTGKYAGNALRRFAGGTKMMGMARQYLTSGGSRAVAAKFAGMGALRAAGAAAGPLNVVATAALVYDLAKGAGKLVARGGNFVKDAIKSAQGTTSKPIFGTGFKDNEVAATSRSRGVMAIQNSRLNARSLLGSEAAMMAAHFG